MRVGLKEDKRDTPLYRGALSFIMVYDVHNISVCSLALDRGSVLLVPSVA